MIPGAEVSVTSDVQVGAERITYIEVPGWIEKAFETFVVVKIRGTGESIVVPAEDCSLV